MILENLIVDRGVRTVHYLKTDGGVSSSPYTILERSGRTELPIKTDQSLSSTPQKPSGKVCEDLGDHKNCGEFILYIPEMGDK